MAMIDLVPIQPLLEDNPDFLHHPDCRESLLMVIEYYKKIGWHFPWICYFARLGNQLVGSAGIKGPPVNNRIEIAYGTFPALRQQGIGAEICRTLVNLSLKTDPRITITARTLPERHFSARILEKNNFRLLGNVWDEEDGDVWEWEYQQQPVNF